MSSECLSRAGRSAPWWSPPDANDPVGGLSDNRSKVGPGSSRTPTVSDQLHTNLPQPNPEFLNGIAVSPACPHLNTRYSPRGWLPRRAFKRVRGRFPGSGALTLDRFQRTRTREFEGFPPAAPVHVPARSNFWWPGREGMGILDAEVSEVTVILEAIEQGDRHASEELLPLVYDELRRLAAHKMTNEAAGQTLQPTALVHEAWIRLVGSTQQRWQNRRHFFGAAAEAMRRILIDRARRKHRVRHGQGLQRLNLDDVDLAVTADDDTLLRVHEALLAFEREAPDRAELVKLRYFTGLSIAEAAETLGISPATAKRQWTFARAWLYRALQNG